jgi:hypothetical protein
MDKPDGILVHRHVGQHRSQSLAENRLQELQRVYPEERFTAIIAARRNASGQFSNHGHFFTFEVYDRGEEEEEPEFTGAFDSPK